MIQKVLSLLVFSGFVLLAHSAAHAQALPLFGPRQYSSSPASPNRYTERFRACNAGATYNLVVQNGTDAGDRIKSATITLNGAEIVGQKDFKRRAGRIERAVTLAPDNTLAVDLGRGAGGSLSISIECTAGCLDIDITSHDSQENTSSFSTMVSGELYNAEGETGVLIEVKGALNFPLMGLAHIQGSDFASLVPLQAGANAITATTTDACGFKARDTVKINNALTDDVREKTIHISARPEHGVSSVETGPIEVSLDADVTTGSPFSYYQWDLNGDGVIDRSGEYLTSVKTTYHPGLYFPRVFARDGSGRTISDTGVIHVLDGMALDSLIRGKWDGMRQALSEGHIDSALAYFTDSSKEKYRRVFEDLGDDLARLGATLEGLTLVSLNGELAEYVTGRDQDGGRHAYFIYFTIDIDGIWKIRSM